MKDDLLVDLTDRQKKAEQYITTAAKLVAPVIEKDMDSGYLSVIEQLKIRVATLTLCLIQCTHSLTIGSSPLNPTLHL